MSKQEKIRIRLKGYDHKAIDQSAAKIVETAKSHRIFVQSQGRFRSLPRRMCIPFSVLRMSTRTAVNSLKCVSTRG